MTHTSVPNTDCILKRKEINDLALKMATQAIQSKKLECAEDTELLMRQLDLYLRPPCPHNGGDEEGNDD